MKKLLQGVHHFQNQLFSTKEDLFQRLSKGQTPDALFITCSDSRIDPTLLTQTEPGELFILRNAGNIVPPYGAGANGESATIEFAVLDLGVRDIIVCGHSLCGAVKSLLTPNATDKMPMLQQWLLHAEATRAIVQENYKEHSFEDQINIAIQENVLVQLEHLKTHPTVAVKLLKGEIALHAWVYKLETGEVFAYDPEIEQFKPLEPLEELTNFVKRHSSNLCCI